MLAICLCFNNKINDLLLNFCLMSQSNNNKCWQYLLKDERLGKDMDQTKRRLTVGVKVIRASKKYECCL